MNSSLYCRVSFDSAVAGFVFPSEGPSTFTVDCDYFIKQLRRDSARVAFSRCNRLFRAVQQPRVHVSRVLTKLIWLADLPRMPGHRYALPDPTSHSPELRAESSPDLSQPKRQTNTWHDLFNYFSIKCRVKKSSSSRHQRHCIRIRHSVWPGGQAIRRATYRKQF